MELPEPLEIKEAIATRIKLCGDDDVCVKMAVWFGNKLPAYLWSRWKEQLIGRGVSWQGMLSIFSDHVDDAARWAMGQATWSDLVKALIREIDAKYRTRPITDYLR